MESTIQQFIAELRQSIEQGTFVKLSLANYKGPDESLQRILVRPVDTKSGGRLLFQFRRKTSDQVKNFEPGEAADQIRSYLQNGFHSGHLFTTESDHQLTIGKRSAKLTAGKPTFKTAEPKSHDREKNYLVDPNAYYLKALGITTEMQKPAQSKGIDENVVIRSDQRDKWKQVNKFVEILAGLYENSELKNNSTLNIVDMGSGKGYLTFAAYDYFGTRTPSSAVTVSGVESRPHLVDLCNQIAQAGGYDGLKFIQGNIADFDPSEVDILIALHACDTATDDALYKGIAAKASIIVAAPCCHHEIKKQLKSPELLYSILKHPVLLERTAETITDGLRSMLLEREGYRTKMFEFVRDEHTPKNNMLVATRRDILADAAKIGSRIEEIKAFYGIETQRLEDHLKYGV